MSNYNEWKPGAGGGTPLSVDTLNEPFHLRDATYDGTNNRLVLSIGRGRAWFDQTLIDYANPQTVYVNAPAVNTTYYVYLTAAGVVVTTFAAPQPGQVPLGAVVVGATLAELARQDRRALLSGMGAVALQQISQHLSDAEAAHPASAISYGGSTGLSATNVEAALDELDADVQAAQDTANDASAAAAAAQSTADAALPKAGGTMTGLLLINGSGVKPVISPKNGSAPSSEYPDGLSCMTVGVSQTGWPIVGLTASVWTFIGERGGGQRIWQLIVEKGGTGIWIRTRNSDDTAWNPFQKVWFEGNDGPGSGLSADNVDGYSPGNGSGNIPINNGTLNTNLNADRTDGFHFRESGGYLEYSADGSTWKLAGLSQAKIVGLIVALS